MQAKGFEQFTHPTLNQLPAALKGAVKAGWYEGSVFFAIVGEIFPIYEYHEFYSSVKGILNYKWSQTGLLDIADKSMAGLLTTLLLGAGTSYYRSGDKPTAIILSLVGIIQALGARNAAL